MKIMNFFTMKRTIVALASLVILSLLSSVAFASYTQWPLIHKGEVRYKRLIKVYNISLYSPSIINAENVLDENISKCLKLDYKVSLSVDKFRIATNKILARQHNQQYLDTIKLPLEKLQKAYKPVKKGDSYNLCYNGKNQTMQLDFNDDTLVIIKSSELAKAYLGIWLSDNKPISMPLYKSFFAQK